MGVTEYLSNYFVNVPLGKQVESMDTSPQFQPYSGVEIIINEDESIFVGDRSGRVLSIENPWGTREQAENILASLYSTGFQYQPYTASGAILNPAAEIGDGLTVNGLYSGIYRMTRNYSPLMAAEIGAPQDEELDHEYPYEPKQDRVYRREIADARASIGLTQDAITAEVLRATEAEGTLSSLVTQTAQSINAKVSQTGGNNSSFGWSLLSNKFSLFAGNKEVFKCTSGGVEIQGKITATSGEIGGFTIGSSSIYKGTSSLSSSTKGVYVGTNGIRIVGSSGSFTANASGSVTMTGTLSIGGTNITAAALRSGAQSAYTNSGMWTSGAAGGEQAKNAFNNATEVKYLKATYLTCTSNYITVKNRSASWRTATLATPGGGQLTIYWLGQGGAIY